MPKINQVENPNELVLGFVPTDTEVRTDNALRIPFDQMPMLGAGIASLAEAFAPAVTNIGAPVLFTVTDAAGNPLGPAQLNAFRDGSGLIGSFFDPITGLGQAHLHVADAVQAPVAAVSPYMLAVTAALIIVTQKLDAIQRTQEEMLEYLRERDKAELRGALQALVDIALDYRFNWGNDTFLKSAHVQAIEVRKQAEAEATFQREQIKGKLKSGLIKTRAMVGDRVNELADHLGEYRLATYMHALASFLDPLLSGNTDTAYLHSVAERISAHSVAYRELYTKCYEAIEADSHSAIDAILVSGVSRAGKTLGKLLAKTPAGEHTSIDEALGTGGERLAKFNEGITDSLMEKVRAMSSPGVLTLQRGVESIVMLREKPMAIAADSEALYLISDVE